MRIVSGLEAGDVFIMFLPLCVKSTLWEEKLSRVGLDPLNKWAGGKKSSSLAKKRPLKPPGLGVESFVATPFSLPRNTTTRSLELDWSTNWQWFPDGGAKCPQSPPALTSVWLPRTREHPSQPFRQLGYRLSLWGISSPVERSSWLQLWLLATASRPRVQQLLEVTEMAFHCPLFQVPGGGAI